VGIRITNEGNDYAANFVKTREVATAATLYGTFFGIEPASKLNDQANGPRIYNATASGARQLHCYYHNAFQSAESLANFRANAPFLKPRQPRVDVALYLSHETWTLDPGAIGRLTQHAALLRDLTDYAMVTRLSVIDGALRGRRALILLECGVLDPAAAAAIEEWTRQGGVTIVASRAGETPAARLSNLRDWREQMLGAEAMPRSADANSSEKAVKPPSPRTRKIAKGWTVYFPEGADDPKAFAHALEPLLRETERHLPGVASLAPLDGRLDRRYATQFINGPALWLDENAAITEVP